LINNFHGKFVVRNCRLEQFKKNRVQWLEIHEGFHRKKEMFKEFFEESKPEKLDKKPIDEEEKIRDENNDNSKRIKGKKSKNEGEKSKKSKKRKRGDEIDAIFASTK